MIIFHVNVFDIQTINKERNYNQKENIEHRITGPVCQQVKQTHLTWRLFDELSGVHRSVGGLDRSQIYEGLISSIGWRRFAFMTF